MTLAKELRNLLVADQIKNHYSTNVKIVLKNTAKRENE